jgi:hypothetical protein
VGVLNTALFDLSSGAPWHLSCAVERVGNDYWCHLHGGDWHLGAVALAQWGQDGVTTACLTVEGHREEAIAVHAAHRLCTAAGGNVVCVAGIHYDGINRSEIDDISRSANELASEAAKRLEALCIGEVT